MATVKFAVPEDNPEFGSNFANMIKLQLLLSQANSLLQTTFKERWSQYKSKKSSELAGWDENPVGNATEFINGIGQKLFKGLGKIQKEFLKSGNVTSWDVTTLTDILLQVDFGLTSDKKERRTLERLKQVRNKVAHTPQAGISDVEFDELWNKAEPSLIHFGCDAKEIQKIKNSTNLSEFENQGDPTVQAVNHQNAIELKEEGNNLYRAKEFVAAIEVYTKAIAYDGLSQVDRGILYSNRSSAYMGLLDTEPPVKGSRQLTLEDASHRALEDAKEVIRLRPAWYKGYFRAGVAYHAARRYEKAVRSFEWVLSLTPGGQAQEEIVAALYESRRKLGIDARNENLDPGSKNNREYMKKRVEESLGRPITDELLEEFKEFNAKRIPGQGDVYKAHDYRDGTGGVKQDYDASVRYYTRAVAAGNAEAMYNLALSYKSGRGVKRDFQMAMKLLKEAASKPVERNYDEALKWYQRASDHGSSEASNNLAFMYQDGKGVPKDVKRAGQYWHLSATQHNPLAMESYAIHCLNIGRDPTQAKHWYEKAVAIGNLHAKLHKAEFDAAIGRLEKDNKEMDKAATNWEAEQGLTAGRKTALARVERMLEKTAPEMKLVFEELKRVRMAGAARAESPHRAPREYNPEVLGPLALKGSITAERLLRGQEYFEIAMEVLLGDLDIPVFCDVSAECCRHDYKAIQLPAEMRSYISQLIEMYIKSFPEEVPNEQDKNARVCYAVLNMHGVEPTLRFVEGSKKKYPDEVFFHYLDSSSLAFLKDYKAAKKVTKESLQLFPGHVELLYNLAAVNWLMADETLSMQEAIQLYRNFLQHAPNDHYKVPESYYAIANIYRVEEMKKMTARAKKKGRRHASKSADAGFRLNLDQINKYYHLGLEAEKVQLPCYLPYESSQKEELENSYRMYALLPGADLASLSASVPPLKPKSNTKTIPSPVTPDDNGGLVPGDEALFRILTAPVRVNFIKEHREFAKQCALEIQRVAAVGPMVHNTMPPRRKQVGPTRLAGLRSITFKEMDVFKDQVYENCVLAVRSIEDPGDVRRPSIMLILEDDNRDVCRGFIYNFNVTTRKEVVEQLGYGAKLSIINPYMRLAMDGGYGIRLDDPSTLFLHTRHTPTVCRFCGKPNAQRKCG